LFCKIPVGTASVNPSQIRETFNSLFLDQFWRNPYNLRQKCIFIDIFFGHKSTWWISSVYALGGHIKRVLVNLTSLQIEELDEMVKEGRYSNRAEAMRDAVRILLEKKKIKELHEVL
jgi:hypothetical protein